MNSQNAEKRNPLGYESIPSLLLKYGIPSVISMLVMSLYNIVDQIFIGHSPAGYLGNAATTVAFPLVTIMLALALLIGNGSAAYISLQMGKGNRGVAQKALGTAVTLLLVLGVAVGAGALLFLEPVLRLLGATDAVMPYAVEYTSVIVMGAPAAMLSTALANIIRADGSPRFSMAASLSGAVLNTILDPIFIFTLGMGVRGAAVATVLSQCVSALLCLYYVLRRANYITLTKGNLRLDFPLAKTLAAYGSSSFVTQMAITVVNVVLNNTLVAYGTLSPYGREIPLSAMGIVMKISAILISCILGIIIGAQPILGYNYGAGNYKRVRQTFLLEVSVTFSLAAVVNVLFVFTPETFIGIFGKGSPQFTEFACMALSTYLCCVFAAGIQIPSANYFQAVGKPLKAMTLTMTRQLFLLVPAIILLPRFFGLQGVLYAAPVADVLSLLITGFFILRELRGLSAGEPGIAGAAPPAEDAVAENS